jgi:4-aminobutyrate aminotransferase / (S)-3-amino-2-methylpropionate transaminase / 5-aminovalerate transaminase
MTSPTTESSIRLITAVPGPRSMELLERRNAYLPRGVSAVIPVFVRRAEGAVVEDVDGNQLLDFVGGIGCQNAGHRAPAVVSAIHEQTDRFLHTCFQITPYESYLELAAWLNAHAPGTSPKKTFFVSTARRP